MPKPWTGRLIGKMHNNEITYEDLGKELGIKKSYVCAILNSRREPPGIQKKMENGVDAIIQRRKNMAPATEDTECK